MRWEQTPVCIGGFGVYERKVIHESKTSCFTFIKIPWTAANDIPSKVKQVVLLS